MKNFLIAVAIIVGVVAVVIVVNMIFESMGYSIDTTSSSTVSAIFAVLLYNKLTAKKENTASEEVKENQE